MQVMSHHCSAGNASSRVPFALRWLQAQLPLLMGKRQEGAAQLYNLLDFCHQQQASSLEGICPSGLQDTHRMPHPSGHLALKINMPRR